MTVVLLLVFISLLTSTAENHFIPSLTLLADFFGLPPAVAGITLLALGNGAPDVFTAYAAANGAGDIALMLRQVLTSCLCCRREKGTTHVCHCFCYGALLS
jgi:sodium/potassium/calcium exchanger 6